MVLCTMVVAEVIVTNMYIRDYWNEVPERGLGARRARDVSHVATLDKECSSDSPNTNMANQAAQCQHK